MQCHHFDAGRCRSCSLLEQPYPAQLADKLRRCRELLADQTGLEWLPPVRSDEAGFRNKAKLVVAGTIEHPTLGIIDRAGHGIDLQDCPLYPPELSSCFAELARFVTLAELEPYDVPGRTGELKYLIVTVSPDGELMLRFVLSSERPVERVRAHLAGLLERVPRLAVVSANIHPEHKAVLEGDRELVLSERELLPMRVGGIELLVRPQSFFQTNTAVAEALYEQAARWAAELDPASVWDLYCGVGGFALHCAAPGRTVLGVESSVEAVESARRSALAAGIEAEFIAADATAFARAAAEYPELVIVNPPRRGIGPELAEALERSTARHVIYSSCNAQSLAADLAAMPSFQATRGRVLDMFPHTEHFEVIVLLERHGAAGDPSRALNS